MTSNTGQKAELAEPLDWVAVTDHSDGMGTINERRAGNDSRQRAFYHLRVLEIPTPRWTAYDAVKYKVTMSPDVTMKLRERALSSAIWYDPG